MDITTRPAPGLGSWPWRRARITPDHTALLDAHRTVTYAELAGRTARLAAALRGMGVGAGDRVAYLGVNAVEVFETFFATWGLGAIVVPHNYRLAGPEIRYMLEDSGATVLVHSGDTDALVAAAAPLPAAVKHVVSVRAGDYEAAIAAAPGRAEEAAVGLDDPAILLYTSGTTGRPKAAILTHGNLTWTRVHVDLATQRLGHRLDARRRVAPPHRPGLGGVVDQADGTVAVILGRAWAQPQLVATTPVDRQYHRGALEHPQPPRHHAVPRVDLALLRQDGPETGDRCPPLRDVRRSRGRRTG